MDNCERRVPLRAHVFMGAAILVLSAILGPLTAWIFGSAVNDDLTRHFEAKNEMRAQCLAGNDRACKLFEVEYAR